MDVHVVRIEIPSSIPRRFYQVKMKINSGLTLCADLERARKKKERSNGAAVLMKC